MIITLFTLIAWLTISAFMLIPKFLNKTENILLYFIIMILKLSIFSIIYKSFKLIQYSYKLEMFLSLLIYRDIIIPLCLLCFANSFFLMIRVRDKIAVTAVVLAILCFLEGLTVGVGMRVIRGGYGYFNILTVPIYMALSALLGKELKKLK